jgi:hypothetical protein
MGKVESLVSIKVELTTTQNFDSPQFDKNFFREGP